MDIFTTKLLPRVSSMYRLPVHGPTLDEIRTEEAKASTTEVADHAGHYADDDTPPLACFMFPHFSIGSLLRDPSKD